MPVSYVDRLPITQQLDEIVDLKKLMSDLQTTHNTIKDLQIEASYNGITCFPRHRGVLIYHGWSSKQGRTSEALLPRRTQLQLFLLGHELCHFVKNSFVASMIMRMEKSHHG